MAIAFYNDYYETILFTFGLTLNALLLEYINKPA